MTTFCCFKLCLDLFKMNGTTLLLARASVLNYEVEPAVNVTIRVTDNGVPPQKVEVMMTLPNDDRTDLLFVLVLFCFNSLPSLLSSIPSFFLFFLPQLLSFRFHAIFFSLFFLAFFFSIFFFSSLSYFLISFLSLFIPTH